MKHFVLAYDTRLSGLISKEEFPTGRLALQSRFQLEDQYSARPEVEIVVLSADSEQQLRVTHRRYFSDLGEFVEAAARSVKPARRMTTRARLAG